MKKKIGGFFVFINFLLSSACEKKEKIPGEYFEAQDTIEEIEYISDEIHPKPFLSARKVENPSDLVGGDNAYGKVGKSYILENSRVRFLIQDKAVAVHLYIYGGNLIDADLHRKEGESGNDQFREIFHIVGFRVSSVDKVEIINDGSYNNEAVVRVTGKDTDLGIIPLLQELGQPLGVTIQTDYILKLDVNYLIIRTEVQNDGDKPIENILVGDFLSFGGASRIFTEEGGFGGKPGEVGALICFGRGASYGWTIAKGKMSVPLVDNSTTVAILPESISLSPKGKSSFDRYFIVGKGDVSSVLEVVHEIRGKNVQKIKGVVLDENFNPIPSARVTAFENGKGKPDKKGNALNQAITSSDGKYSLTLLSGKYDLVSSAEGRLRKTKTGIDITNGEKNVDFNMGAKSFLTLDIKEVDEGGKVLGNIPAKVSLYCKKNAEAPWFEIGEWEKYGLCKVIWNIKGNDKFAVKEGTYKAVVSRGIEYERDIIDELLVEEGKNSFLEAKLLRSVDTKGYLSADFHQHTLGSLDAELTHIEKVIENLTEGVEIAAITDHDNITSYKPAIKKLGVSSLINSIDGDEVTFTNIGHFNIFSPKGNEESLYPYIGAKLYANKSIPQLFEDLRLIPDVKVIQVNHPRSGYSGYLNFIKFDPVSTLPLANEKNFSLGFDTIEVKDSLGSPEMYLEGSDKDIQNKADVSPGDIPVMRDWFSMLNKGLHICAVGVSDAHDRNDGVGYSRNFLSLGTDNPKKVSTEDIITAILAQKNIVSNGVFIRVLFDGKEKMGHTEVVEAVGGKVVVHIIVMAPSWIDTSRFEVYANGRPIILKEEEGIIIEDENPAGNEPLFIPLPLSKSPSSATIRVDTDVQLFPKSDTWYVFVVKGNGSLTPVGNGFPFAYTNPLYVDVDGGGFQ